MSFTVAGLWKRSRGEERQALESCTIIVTDASDLVRSTHDRMRVTFAREDHGPWVDPENRRRETLEAM